MTTNVDLEKLQKDAVDIFNQGFACSESVIYAIKKNFELDMSDDAIAMSSGFPWGLGGGGCICGALAGATMCIGYFFGRKTPGDPKVNRCFKLSNEIHDFFKEYCGATCCRVLTKGKEKNSPERKAQCTDFVAAAAACIRDPFTDPLHAGIETDEPEHDVQPSSMSGSGVGCRSCKT